MSTTKPSWAIEVTTTTQGDWPSLIHDRWTNDMLSALRTSSDGISIGLFYNSTQKGILAPFHTADDIARLKRDGSLKTTRTGQWIATERDLT